MHAVYTKGSTTNAAHGSRVSNSAGSRQPHEDHLNPGTRFWAIFSWAEGFWTDSGDWLLMVAASSCGLPVQSLEKSPRQTSALSVSHWYCTVEILTLAAIQTHTVNVYHWELFSSVQTIDKFGNEQTMYSWRLQSFFFRPASNATNRTSGLSLQQHTSPIQMTVPSLMPQTCTKSVQSLVHPDIQIKFLAWLIFKRMESASAFRICLWLWSRASKDDNNSHFPCSLIS